MAKAARRAPASSLKTTSRLITKRSKRPRAFITSISTPDAIPSSPVSDDAPAPPSSARSKLVGRSVSVVWPEDGEAYGALVVGYDEEIDAHKVYFWADGSTAVLSRNDTKIKKEDAGEGKDLGDLLGMRVFVFKEVEGESLPFEAFVIRRLGSQTYEFMFTSDDKLTSFNVVHPKENWGPLATREDAVDGKPLVKWGAEKLYPSFS